MTALAEALVAAQRQAIAALEKAYIADTGEEPFGRFGSGGFRDQLNAIGATDVVEQDYLVACLDTLRTYGSQSPTAATNGKPDEPKPMTDRQRRFITSLCDERSVPYPHFDALDSVKASEVINELQAGTYDPDKWGGVPF